jgi:hypothetical protein
MAEPRQRAARQRPCQVGSRHFAAEPDGLSGPEIGEIDLAQPFGSRLEGAMGGCRVGKWGASADMGPTSRIARLATPRAGRPVMTLVMTVEWSWACASATRANGVTFDSGQRR